MGALGGVGMGLNQGLQGFISDVSSLNTQDRAEKEAEENKKLREAQLANSQAELGIRKQQAAQQNTLFEQGQTKVKKGLEMIPIEGTVDNYAKFPSQAKYVKDYINSMGLAEKDGTISRDDAKGVLTAMTTIPYHLQNLNRIAITEYQKSLDDLNSKISTAKTGEDIKDLMLKKKQTEMDLQSSMGVDTGLVNWAKANKKKYTEMGSAPDGYPVVLDASNPSAYLKNDGQGNMKPYHGPIKPKVEHVVNDKPATMGDIKIAFDMDMQAAKNNLLVEMTPTDRNNYANMTPEQLQSALLAGSIKSLPADRKAYYQKQFDGISQKWQGYTKQILGDKKVGGKPLGGAPATPPPGQDNSAKGKTYGDLYKIATNSGSSSKAVEELGKLGYSTAQARDIIKKGLSEGAIQ